MKLYHFNHNGYGEEFYVMAENKIDAHKYLLKYLQEKIDYDQMIDQLHIASRQFAKRQKTWFRRWEKQGRKIYWLNPESALDEAKQIIKELAD